MNNITINHDGYTFMRINKTKAKGVYQSGKPIAVIPCNMHPFNLFQPAYITPVNCYREQSFDSLVNEFEFYNCNYECGYYAAFYVVSGNIQDSWKGAKND